MAQHTKGARTRERLFTAAVERFARDGFQTASLRAIARDAGVTPALLYRYFPSKDALVAELYGRALDAWAERARALPAGSWAERTLWLTRLAFEVLAPYRTLLRVLVPAMLDGDPTASPLRNDTAQRVAQPTFLVAVTEAKDAPRARHRAAYAELAYLGHLALILFWVTDATEDQRATEELMEHAKKLAPWVHVGLRTPRIGPRLLAMATTLASGLGREPPP